MPLKITLRSFLIAFLFAAAVFGFFLWQFSPEQRFTLFFLNKALADTSIIMIGMSFLLGPLCKIIPGLGKHLHIRREFGLTGFFLVIAHLAAALGQYSTRFPAKWYIDHMWGVTAALLATVIFLALAITSSRWAIHKMGGKNWKTLQRTGYFALALGLVHVYFAASPRWQMWFAGKVTMPNSFVVFVFGIVVIVVRILAHFVDVAQRKTGR